MSRIGKRPITIPSGVKVAISGGKVTVEGSKGKLEFILPQRITVTSKDNIVEVKRDSNQKIHRAFHGTVRAIITNMIIGVSEGYKKQLEIIGVGYRAQSQGNNLNMQLGFSHPVVYAIPEGVKIETPKPTQITVSGIDKRLVGQVAAEIRSKLPPEPYKGKGIRYVGEYVRRKLGKAVAKQA